MFASVHMVPIRRSLPASRLHKFCIPGDRHFKFVRVHRVQVYLMPWVFGFVSLVIRGARPNLPAGISTIVAPSLPVIGIGRGLVAVVRTSMCLASRWPSLGVYSGKASRGVLVQETVVSPFRRRFSQFGSSAQLSSQRVGLAKGLVDKIQ